VLLTGLSRAGQLCGPRAPPAGQTDACPEGSSLWKASLPGQPHTRHTALQVPRSCVTPWSWESRVVGPAGLARLAAGAWEAPPLTACGPLCPSRPVSRVCALRQGHSSGQEAVGTETWALQCLWAHRTSVLPVSRKRHITETGPTDRGEECARSLLEICSLYVLPCPCTPAQRHRHSSHPVLARCLRCPSPACYLVSITRKLWSFPRETRLLPVIPSS